jgi:hypothetical protein
MKNILKTSWLLALAGIVLGGCSKFDEINTNPTAASGDQVQVEYFIDNSIIHAQQNPGVSERAFILYWAAAGRQVADADGATFSQGGYNDEWLTEYYNNISQALNYINTAVEVAQQQIGSGDAKLYTNNLLQVARIWRAYLMSEMSDCFGPIPVKGFQGTNPDFSSVKDVYYYMLDELKDASAKLDFSTASPDIANQDPAFGFDYSKWQRYANSLRLRLAMRLSEVDPQKAKTEFEDADTKPLLEDQDQIFQIQEKPGWDDLSGVYSRSWYLLPISATLNNLTVNLGGIKTKDQLPGIITGSTDVQQAMANIKPNTYVGQRFKDYFSTMTNNPVAGYWYNGLHATIDPRMYKMFYIPGNINSPTYPSAGWVNTDTKGYLYDPNNSTKKVDSINAKFTWNPIQDGNWATMASINGLITIGAANGFVPSLVNSFRQQTAKRVFFGPWETYFLLAEAAVRGWSTPITGKDAYEKGIAASFEYWGVSQYLSGYLASTDYNTDGTSVNWDDTNEPPATHAMTYVDGVTGIPGIVQVKYPVNNLYKNGTVRNDQLTKILTQKFIAQGPWLPLETWSDHRRLGLPFFENVVIQDVIPSLPNLTASNYMQCSIKDLPQRMKYPSELNNSNAKGYQQAVQLLGAGGDNVLTPLWWAQQKP